MATLPKSDLIHLYSYRKIILITLLLVVELGLSILTLRASQQVDMGPGVEMDHCLGSQADNKAEVSLEQSV